MTTDAALAAACLSNGRVGVRADFWQDGQKVAAANLDDWSVKVQSGSARALSGTVVGFGNLIPDTTVIGQNRYYNTGTYGEGTYGGRRRRVLSGLLLPGVTTVKVWWRIYDGDTWLEAKVGEFDVASEDFTIGGDDSETISLTGFDARRAIDKAGWVGPWKVTAGNAWTRAVQLAQSIRPGLQADSAADIGFTKMCAPMWFGVGSQGGLTPWQAIEKLARFGGYTPYIDGDGRLTAVDVPALGSNPDPDWTFREGNGGSLFSAGTGHDDEDLVNAVIVIGSSTKRGVIHAQALNNAPNDPHRISRIGRRALEINASGIDSESDAQELADKELRRARGAHERFTVEGVLLPFLNEWAVIKTVSEDLDVADVAILNNYEIHGRQDPATVYEATRRVA